MSLFLPQNPESFKELKKIGCLCFLDKNPDGTCPVVECEAKKVKKLEDMVDLLDNQMKKLEDEFKV